MDVFSAEQFNKHPRQVYRAADLNGEVRIDHDRYPDRVFVLTSRERKPLDGLSPENIKSYEQKYVHPDFSPEKKASVGDTVELNGKPFKVTKVLAEGPPIDSHETT